VQGVAFDGWEECSIMLHVSACSTATSARDDTAHQAKIPGTPHRRFPSVLPVLGRPDPCRRRAFTETPPVADSRTDEFCQSDQRSQHQAAGRGGVNPGVDYRGKSTPVLKMMSRALSGSRADCTGGTRRSTSHRRRNRALKHSADAARSILTPMSVRRILSGTSIL